MDRWDLEGGRVVTPTARCMCPSGSDTRRRQTELTRRFRQPRALQGKVPACMWDVLEAATQVQSQPSKLAPHARSVFAFAIGKKYVRKT